jgi:tetratricopeptide (TPR) repeat protein
MGMGIQAGKDARRESSVVQAENVEALHQAALKRRNAQAIIELSASNSLGSAQLLAQADRLISGLDESAAGRILFQMGDMYARSGRWPMAAETYRALLQRYPNHPLAQTATLWLMQYYASGEAVKRESGTAMHMQNMTKGDAAENPGEGGPSGDRLALATALGKEIERSNPELYSEHAFRFPLAAVERQKTTRQQTEPYYLAASRSARRDAWSQCALGEIALEDRKEKMPKPSFVCVRAQEKPMLDGVLDEEAWRKTKPVSLVSTQRDDDQWPAVAALTFDEEYLYVAVTCKKKGRGENNEGSGERGEGRENAQELGNGGQGTGMKESNGDAEEKPKKQPRPRDSDLSMHDRVDLLIDIDRDYATYYRFTVDQRGWTAESCFGDSSWNPDWYVASREDDETWTVEFAIPLEQIVEKLPQPREVWAIGIQRTSPGVGFQSWTTPASTEIRPEGFGYLIFD